MSSGVEVMISHAENLSRHLERVREDLNELRHKERLAADEPVIPGPLANGSTRFGKIRGMFTFVDNLLCMVLCYNAINRRPAPFQSSIFAGP